MKPRVVVDTSTLISAAIRPDSVPHRVLLAAVDQCEVCASIDTLSELDEVLARPKFNQYLDAEARHEFMSLVHEHFRLMSVLPVDPDELKPCCRDPRDFSLSPSPPKPASSSAATTTCSRSIPGAASPF